MRSENQEVEQVRQAKLTRPKRNGHSQKRREQEVPFLDENGEFMELDQEEVMQLSDEEYKQYKKLLKKQKGGGSFKKKLSKRKETIQFYTEVGEQILSNGAYDKNEAKRSDELSVGYRKIFTKNSEKVIYTVTSLPDTISREFFEELRLAVEDYGVAVNISMKILPYKINWEDSNMKTKKDLAKRYVESRASDTTDDFSTKREKQELRDTQRLSETFGYYTSVEERNRELCRADLMIELCRIRNNERAVINFKIAQTNLVNFFNVRGFNIEEVKFNLFEYFKSRAPSSGRVRDNAVFETKFVLSDEIIARLSGFTGGSIGKNGVLMGKDITNNKLIYKEMVRSSGEAENICIVAETGGGKSFYVKALITMMLANGFNVSVLDVDGEYESLTKAVGGVIISFDNGYFDTTEISNPTGDERVDNNLLIESRQSTTVVFACLTDIKNGMTPNERKIFTEAYNRMYDAYNILIEEPYTWGNSKELSYHKLYEHIKMLNTEECARDIGVPVGDIAAFVAKLSTFFEPDGLNSFIFKNKVTINHILARESNSPVMVDVVLNLQKNATKGEELIIQTIKQLTANYLTTMIANRNKHSGQFTTEIVEEYQRYAHQPDVSDMILTKITGNRKRNVNTILITNSPLELLKSGSASSYAVIENINNFVIGALKSRTINEVCEVFNLDNCESLLKQMSSSNKFKHCFMLKLNNRDVTIAKWDLPPNLRQSPIFKTRDSELKIKDTVNLSWEDLRSDSSRKKEGSKILEGKRKNK